MLTSVEFRYHHNATGDWVVDFNHIVLPQSAWQKIMLLERSSVPVLRQSSFSARGVGIRHGELWLSHWVDGSVQFALDPMRVPCRLVSAEDVERQLDKNIQAFFSLLPEYQRLKALFEAAQVATA